MSEQKCKCCDQFECNCPERCTNQKQDGIEERAVELTEKEKMSEAWCDGYNTREIEFQLWLKAKTATLTDENNRLREALENLIEDWTHQLDTVIKMACVAKSGVTLPHGTPPTVSEWDEWIESCKRSGIAALNAKNALTTKP